MLAAGGLQLQVAESPLIVDEAMAPRRAEATLASVRQSSVRHALVLLLVRRALKVLSLGAKTAAWQQE